MTRTSTIAFGLLVAAFAHQAAAQGVKEPSSPVVQGGYNQGPLPSNTSPPVKNTTRNIFSPGVHPRYFGRNRGRRIR